MLKHRVSEQTCSLPRDNSSHRSNTSDRVYLAAMISVEIVVRRSRGTARQRERERERERENARGRSSERFLRHSSPPRCRWPLKNLPASPRMISGHAIGRARLTFPLSFPLADASLGRDSRDRLQTLARDQRPRDEKSRRISEGSSRSVQERSVNTMRAFS